MPIALDADAIAPLLERAAHTATPAVALGALGAATRFPLVPSAWHVVAVALARLIDREAPGSPARREALALGVRVPLLSFRQHLRGLSEDPGEPDREVLQQALARVGDASTIASVLARASDGPAAAIEALAALPIEQQLQLQDLPPLPDDADGITRFWWAFARARLGDTVALDAVLAGEVGTVELFDGSPWAAYEAVARVRPLPEALQRHLLMLLERLEHDPGPADSPDVQRMRQLTVWAATGVRDADGQEPPAPSAPAPVLGHRRVGTGGDGGDARALALRRQLPAVLFDGTLAVEAVEDLHGLPRGASPALIVEVLREGGRRAAALPDAAPVSSMLGNRIVDLIRHCPIDGPEPVTEYARAALDATRRPLDDGQLAWVLARDEPAHLIHELTLLSAAVPSVEAQLAVLAWLAGAGDCLAGRDAGPARGAGPSGGGVGGVALIDDLAGLHQAQRPDESPPPSDARAEPSPERPKRGVAGRARPGTRGAPAPAPAAAEAEARRVHARILQGGQVRQTFVAGVDNTIRCWIGLPEAGSTSTAEPIPHTPIPAAGLPLTVQLCWRDGDGQDHHDACELVLPAERTARTRDCDLRLHVPDGERYVRAEIVFLFGGRIFEAVLLEAFALAPDEPQEPTHQIRLRVQASRRQVIELPDSPPVDTVVLSDPPPPPDGATAAAAPTLRRFGGAAPGHFDLRRASTAIAWLNETLHVTQTVIVRKQAAPPGAARRPADEFDESDAIAREMLRDMARHGTLLYKELRDQGFGDPGGRIQILGDAADDHVPLEFVYDRGYPSSKAQWCTEGLQALKAGADGCPVCRFPGVEDDSGSVGVLCPYGFWSLRKVIERVTPMADGEGSDPGAGRRLLPAMTSVAFASSHNVPEAERLATRSALEASFDTVLCADDWQQWRQVVRQHPTLLLVLPHHGVQAQLDYLEIGDARLDEDLGKLSAAQIDARVVNPDGRDPGPVVLLLGCQTASVTETGYGDLARRIQKQHASIVLGTLAQILGRHAAPIAREFAQALAQVPGPETDFGSVMLQVRRRMLARGCLIAMCLVALGDAQWRLQPRPAPGAARLRSRSASPPPP